MALPKEKEKPKDSTTSFVAAKPKRLTAEDVAFPSGSIYRGNARVQEILGELFRRGYKVVDVAEVDARAKAKDAFDRYIDTLAQKDPTAERFLSDGHEVYDVSWLGYILYLIGPAVGGRDMLPLRRPPRGVSDRSGR